MIDSICNETEVPGGELVKKLVKQAITAASDSLWMMDGREGCCEDRQTDTINALSAGHQRTTMGVG